MNSDKNTDFISRIGDLLSIDRDEVLKSLDGLDVDTTMDVLDAVSQDDATRVQELINNTSGNEAKSSEEQDVEDLSPLFQKKKKSKKRKIEVEETTDKYQPNIGDPVSVGDNEGIVKITKGPNGTLGVMIDGELTMVGKNEVKPIKESVLGMTNLPGLARMQELAGIQATFIPEPEGVSVGKPVDQAITCPLEQVMCLFDQIESALPTLQIRDAKAVRERLNNLSIKLNENHQTAKKRL